MKSYRVGVTDARKGYLIVTAKDEQEALEKVHDLVENYGVILNMYDREVSAMGAEVVDGNVHI